MKRYKIEPIYIKEIEHPDGKWVRYEDYKAEFFRITEIYEDRIRELKNENDLKPEIRKLRHEIRSLQQTIRIAGVGRR